MRFRVTSPGDVYNPRVEWGWDRAFFVVTAAWNITSDVRLKGCVCICVEKKKIIIINKNDKNSFRRVIDLFWTAVAVACSNIVTAIIKLLSLLLLLPHYLHYFNSVSKTMSRHDILLVRYLYALPTRWKNNIVLIILIVCSIYINIIILYTGTYRP